MNHERRRRSVEKRLAPNEAKLRANRRPRRGKVEKSKRPKSGRKGAGKRKCGFRISDRLRRAPFGSEPQGRRQSSRGMGIKRRNYGSAAGESRITVRQAPFGLSTQGRRHRRRESSVAKRTQTSRKQKAGNGKGLKGRSTKYEGRQGMECGIRISDFGLGNGGVLKPSPRSLKAVRPLANHEPRITPSAGLRAPEWSHRPPASRWTTYCSADPRFRAGGPPASRRSGSGTTACPAASLPHARGRR